LRVSVGDVPFRKGENLIGKLQIDRMKPIRVERGLLDDELRCSCRRVGKNQGR